MQGTSAFIGSAWFTHSMACKAAGIGLLAPSKSLLLTCLVTAWGARLAGYLFYRVLAVGKDGAHPKPLERYNPKQQEPLKSRSLLLTWLAPPGGALG